MAQLETLWRKGKAETIIVYALFAVTLIIAVAFLGDEAAHHIKQFEAWISSLGPWALIAFVLLYIPLFSMLVPESILGIIAGATFGFTQGLLALVCANVLAASLQYGLSSGLLKPTVNRFLASRPNLGAVQSAVLRQQLRLQLLIRLTPLNRAVTSYVLGAGGVRFPWFLAACVAMLPNLCVEAYFGFAGRHLAKAASQPEHTLVLHDAMLLAGLVVAIGVMFQVSKMARRAVESAAQQGTEELHRVGP